MQGHTQFVVGFQQFGIDLIETLRAILVCLGCREIGNRLEINGVDVQVRPVRLRHFKPMFISLQTPFKQPLRLILTC